MVSHLPLGRRASRPRPTGSIAMPLRHALVLVGVLTATTARGQDQTASPDLVRAARQITDRTNRFRQDQHRSAVTVNDKLTATARDFAAWMARTDMYGHEA